ncbi:MAG TPA: hypothetical protein H9742_10245 [Candidatus Acetatifactor stercoripullorum]|uniref:Uncharacterized protein n=1 Tax=Candidatus Acetatifactor stercoripullorum TaxID=2838414 RepID=A0A9D1R5X6_9FIRM|nr:hypothetical protein [uncultured Acetatifactor sp.]HIW81874.1 hypothetical protein [Candidatus Acetatifactor stercoripullorum]
MKQMRIGEKIGWSKESRIGRLVFILLLFLYTGVMLYLFLMQCYEVPDFISDMPAYVEKTAGIAGDYEFPYPLFFTVAKLFAVFLGAPAAVAVTTAILNSFGVCTAKYYMNRQVRSFVCYEEMSEKKRCMTDICVTGAVFALFLLGNLYSPKNTAFFGFDYAYRCMGIYTPNPVWNATYMATRPFAVICFFEAVNLLSEYRENFQWKKCVPFALSLFLTTITKPSYTLVVVPVFGLVLLFHAIRSKGKSLKNAFFVCVTMIPTGIDLLYQYSGVFSGTNVLGEETGIGFAFAKVWGNFSSNIPLSIVMGMALPLGVLVLNLGELKKNGAYRFAWLNYLMGAGMFLVLYEKGFRMLHANFSWGYMHGMFFVFLMTLALVIKNTVQWRKSWRIIFAAAEWAVLLAHLACGLNFLWYALQGNDLAGF